VSARYLPSRELAGDCFDYRWIDDDHLISYVIDVSGHGIEPALVSMSVHNMLRSGSVPASTLADPGRLLTELNRLFQMDTQGGNYFTIWYGVYQASTRTLRYAAGGHPPALLMAPRADSGPATVSRLASNSPPLGMFEDTEFDCTTVAVPAASHLLIYSDGAYELPLPDGRMWSLDDFVNLVTRYGDAPEWSLSNLVDALRARTIEGQFDDDCSLVCIDFP
jgi:sigma-B regulation protein RsbU (phosphoserine phosphatase)